MPRYPIDVTDAGRPCPDDAGIDVAGDGEARDEALGLLPALARDALLDGDEHEVVVTVRDGAGMGAYEARLRLSGRWWPGRR